MYIKTDLISISIFFLTFSWRLSRHPSLLFLSHLQGCSLQSLNRIPSCSPPLPPLDPQPGHTVLVRVSGLILALNELNMECGCLKIWNFSWSVQLDITKERNSTSISNHVLYIVYCINTIGLNWQEKSTLSMIEKKGPQSTNKIVKHVGNMAQDEKQFLN